MHLADKWSLHRIPIAPFALAVSAGVAIALYVEIPVGLLFIACVGMAGIALLMGFLRFPIWLLYAFLILFFAALGSYRATNSLARNVRREIGRMAETCDSIQICGRVLYPINGRGDVQSLTLHPARLSSGEESLDCGSLCIRLFCDSAVIAPFRYADDVYAWGSLRPSTLASASSSGTLINILTRREAATVFCETGDMLRSPARGFSLRRLIDALRFYIVTTFDKRLSPDASALGKALVLGDRRDFSPAFSNKLRLTGLSHVFALSGMNVGFLLAIVWVVTGILCVPRVARLILLIFSVLLYMELGREAPSLVRASLMAAFFVMANLLYRRNDILNMVAGAVLIELVWRPLDLLDAGFLLSYLAVVGIIGGYGFLRAQIVRMVGQPRSTWIRGGVDLVAVTTGAQIGTLPLVGFLFHRVPLLGAFGNLIAVPGFAVLLLWSVVLLLAEAVVPSLAAIIAASMNALSFVLGKCVEFFSVLPLASVAVPSFSPLLLISLYGAVGWLVIGAALNRFRWIAGGLLLAGSLVAWGSLLGGEREKPEISFISVGHGDAILLTGGEYAVLIDTGPSFGDWSAANRILPFLAERGIRKLDAVVLTHADNDHIGGTADILQQIPVSTIFTNGDSCDTQTFLLARIASQARGVPWRSLAAGDRLTLPRGMSLMVLSPDTGMTDEAEDSNRRSLVFKLECEGATALLTADIDSLIEKDILPWGSVLVADLLKVAHHGSKSSSSGVFLRAVSPQISVISSSAANRFNHPDPSVIARLRGIGSQVYSTATQGSLCFVSENGRWKFVETRAQRLARLWKLGYG